MRKSAKRKLEYDYFKLANICMYFLRTKLWDYFREWASLQNCPFKSFSKWVNCKKKCSQ